MRDLCVRWYEFRCHTHKLTKFIILFQRRKILLRQTVRIIFEALAQYQVIPDDYYGVSVYIGHNPLNDKKWNCLGSFSLFLFVFYSKLLIKIIKKYYNTSSMQLVANCLEPPISAINKYQSPSNHLTTLFTCRRHRCWDQYYFDKRECCTAANYL